MQKDVIKVCQIRCEKKFQKSNSNFAFLEKQMDES
jgi:hypothetical protein